MLLTLLSNQLLAANTLVQSAARYDLMHYYYQIIFTNCGANVKYIARIPKDRSESYEAALRPVRFASICYEEHVDADYSLPVSQSSLPVG